MVEGAEPCVKRRKELILKDKNSINFILLNFKDIFN
jgi:hypothetical protein